MEEHFGGHNKCFVSSLAGLCGVAVAERGGGENRLVVARVVRTRGQAFRRRRVSAREL